MASNAPPSVESSLGTILGDLADNAQSLVRQEVALVKAQTTETISEQVKQKGTAVGLMLGAAIFALLGLAFLGVMLILALQAWFGLSAWLSALLVTLLYFVVGGGLAFVGKNKLTASADSEAAADDAAEQAAPDSGARAY